MKLEGKVQRMERKQKKEQRRGLTGQGRPVLSVSVTTLNVMGTSSFW